MASARTNVQQSSMAAIPILIGIAGGLVAIWFRYPGFAAMWLGFVVAAWIEPPAVLTGTKVAGRPTALDETEDLRLEKYRYWSTLKTSLLPGMAWLPGWWPRFSWCVAALSGAVVWHVPVWVEQVEADPVVWQWVNALTVFALIAGLTHAKRTVTMCPGVTVDVVVKAPVRAAAGALLGAGVGAAAALVGLPKLSAWPLMIEAGLAIPTSTRLTIVLIALGMLGGMALMLRGPALNHWRSVYHRRREWTPRWRDLKQVPEPFLIDTQQVGPFTVDTFESRGAATEILKIGDTKITPVIGAGVKLGYLTAPNVKAGEPVPGTVHPNRFVIAQCDADQWPNTYDAQIPEDVRLLAARTEWQPRWKGLKADPAPELVSTELMGPARIDTFVASGNLGSVFFLPLTTKIAPHIGADVRAAVLPVWDASIQHPVNFRIVQWSSLPDVSNPDIDQNLLALLLDCQMLWSMEVAKAGVPRVTEIAPLHESDSTVLWGVDLDFPSGPGWKSMRRDGFAAEVAGALGASALVDHNSGAMYLGDTAGATVDDGLRKKLDELANEDRWSKLWLVTLKQGKLPPTLQHRSVATKRLNDGTEVHRYAFAPLQGIDPTEFFGLEPKLQSALVPSPYLTMTGWQLPNGRPGERHPQLFTVYHAEKPVPANPDSLGATASDANGDSASMWVLRGMVNNAFAAARRSRPEVTGVRCLTRRAASKHVWEVNLRLFGGDTLADIRGVREKLRQALGAEWLRVAEYEHGVSLYMGTDPSKVKLADPKDQALIDSLNWTQAFIDSGVTSRSGLLPHLTASSTMPKNTDVQVLDFVLPPGIALVDIREKVNRLKSAVGCEFLSPLAVSGEANRITIQAAKADPMPRSVPFDYELVSDHEAIPFGEGVDGEPVVYDWKTSPHLLVSGGSGSGKSAAMQMLMTGALVRGAEVFVGDPMKGAADFKFADPWCRSITVTIEDTAAMMRGIYAEVERRRSLNSKYGVGSYRDLPDDVRPAHVIVIVDEFTSLIELDKSAGRTALDDPEMEAERLRVLAENNERIAIGQLTGKIAREARSAGVTMWLGAQKLTSKALDSVPGGDSLKVNMARLVLGVTTFGERMSALRLPEFAPDLGTDVPIGRGLFESSVAASVAVHAYWDKSSKLADFLTEQNVPKAQKFDLTQFVRKNEDEGPAVQTVELDLFDGDTEQVSVVDDSFSLEDFDAPAEADDNGGLDLSHLVVGWNPDDGETDDSFPFEQPEADDSNPFEELQNDDDDDLLADFAQFEPEPEQEPDEWGFDMEPEPEPQQPQPQWGNDTW